MEVKTLPDSEAEILVEIPFEKLENYKQKALAHLKEHANIPGFRTGKVPEKMILEKVGEAGLLEEASELLIKEAYPPIIRELIDEKKLDIIGEPRVAVTKLAPQNPFEFKITLALFPTFALPDYKKIAKDILSKEDTVEVSEKEMNDVIDEIRKIRGTKKGEGDEIELAELTDEFVKEVGPFETVADFKTKVKENLLKEKEFRAKEKRRLGIVGKIIEGADIPLPRVLVESELDRMLAQLADDLKRSNKTLPEYLEHIKKTESELRVDWEKDAKTRVKFELVLGKIAELEKIEANKDDVEKEAKHIMEHYAGADETKVKLYVGHQMKNEAVFAYLESQK